MLSRRQLWALVGLTLMWGVNWPMMKLSLQELTPLYFRASTMLLGAAWLFVYVQRRGERMWPTRAEWVTIAWLGLPNVLGWHTFSIFGVQELASGRAAIVGFTMPIFTVLLGAAFFGERTTPRVRLAVVSAGIAIALLLWHELSSLSGRPVGIAWMLGAAVSWGLGTLMFRRARFQLSPMVVTVWMLLLGGLVLWPLAIALEPLPHPEAFSLPMWLALAYGVLINYGVAQLIWFGLARHLPPATSAMSVMAIPLVGTLSATFIVGEIPHWQDWLAIVFVMVAIASVLLPSRAARAASAQ
ncbi:MAG: EamA family transporter [Hydrogenophaga sp.]|uniref:DMT family transporter n=1 Tax=Hydrogenophaga sp. TaxID=1904254 RepID=UPI00169F245D|nr:DMT family transporter [Hydrogenophaga sp.]NIM40641.1 EamA family transporter [Hydrogenophaga sp.]NIN26116.1 EamA family transporter [Hydrogenophaga sp.]NIN30981.1 EamA family transporter [Hydrogenophaga sp.]NIN55024.1 EamA family transporter [Hydrogenophaga sp.]NIO51067.1 EamA family transporter [Hydrogenophaga sp.]